MSNKPEKNWLMLMLMGLSIGSCVSSGYADDVGMKHLGSSLDAVAFFCVMALVYLAILEGDD